MKATEGTIGRVFVIRLEDGDLVPDCLEEFAEKNAVRVGFVTIIGGVGEGKLVTGPRNAEDMPPVPTITAVNGAHEVVGAGVIAPDEEGRPKLHLHAALARSETVVGGCTRLGIKTWLVGEVIMVEILGTAARRVVDQQSGFSLLET